VALGWCDDPKARRPDCLAFPLCASKQKELAINNQDDPKFYIFETNAVSSFLMAGPRKNGGEKMKVSSIMLLKTNGGKMSEIGLSIMLMKRNVVTSSFPLC
jgi:hypothetical protein